MDFKYFDSHSHLNFPQYDDDREAVIERMKEEGVGTICVGTDKKTSIESVDLSMQYDHIWSTVGVHPTDSVEGFDSSGYEQILTNRVVAIGECGLDYFREENRRNDDIVRQKNIFEKQIIFAVKNDLPLMLHMRPSPNSMDAYEDGLDILESYSKEFQDKVRGNAHFFVGNTMIAQRFLDLGFSIAFPGVITFAEEFKEVVRYVPLSCILSETDSPFASPNPFRGKRNSPLYVSHVVDAIARIKDEPVEEVGRIIVDNALRVFSIDN